MATLPVKFFFSDRLPIIKYAHIGGKYVEELSILLKGRN
jgi:hypothetical protein